MISNSKDIYKLYKQIGERLTSSVTFYIIGGAMMLEHGLKTATKDIDIIVETRNEYDNTKKALKKIGFTEQKPSKEYQRFEISNILIHEDYRIDLFNKTVCKRLQLTKTMKKRAQHLQTYNNLTVNLCSATDVLLLKSITERQGDLDDSEALATSQQLIKWKEFLQELKHQTTTNGEDVWITWVAERLEILEERGIQIPIMKEIYALVEQYYTKLEKQLNTT